MAVSLAGAAVRRAAGFAVLFTARGFRVGAGDAAVPSGERSLRLGLVVFGIVFSRNCCEFPLNYTISGPVPRERGPPGEDSEPTRLSYGGLIRASAGSASADTLSGLQANGAAPGSALAPEPHEHRDAGAQTPVRTRLADLISLAEENLPGAVAVGRLHRSAGRVRRIRRRSASQAVWTGNRSGATQPGGRHRSGTAQARPRSCRRSGMGLDGPWTGPPRS